MALRARLSPPAAAAPIVWPWHTAKIGSISARVLFAGDRRMEAETYLSSGYGIRVAIESKAAGWRKPSSIASCWQPGRLKGIQLPSSEGTPFLAATQVFDVRPIPRKWLALEKTSDAAGRWCPSGTIVVTCSGSVGRPGLTYDAHKDVLISHDLLRVSPISKRDYGWIYAYLLASQTRAMARGAHYGHIIKHLETSHLDALPVPDVDDEQANSFSERVSKVLELRNQSYHLTLESENRLTAALGSVRITDLGERGFRIASVKALSSRRRRFDAAFYNPGVQDTRKHMERNGKGFRTIGEAQYDVWLPTRFRRIPAEGGVTLVESAALTEANPDLNKRIAEVDFGDPYKGRVKSGWLLMARSGQTYGILGTAVLAEAALENKIITDDIIRMKPKQGATITPGYLLTALSHPMFGRPLVKALAYGSSIPHIDPGDLLNFPVVRLSKEDEERISELAESAAKARSAADILKERSRRMRNRSLRNSWSASECGSSKLASTRIG